MRKPIVLLAMALLLALTTGLVAAQDDVDSVDPTGETVVYWHQFSEAQEATMQGIIDEFNSTNEWGITVQAVPQGS